MVKRLFKLISSDDKTVDFIAYIIFANYILKYQSYCFNFVDKCCAILLEVRPAIAAHIDSKLMLPLHHFADNFDMNMDINQPYLDFDSNALRLLLNSYPNAAQDVNDKGENPLHRHASIERPNAAFFEYILRLDAAPAR